MFVRILSYHQVMPSFLDFVFSFGEQHRAKDFYFCGFRSESRMNGSGALLRMPAKHRSGRELRCCYSLRSVETSTSQSHWPWSIRQCAVYHSYDVESEVATWIVVKANKLFKSRVKALRKESLTRTTESPELETSKLQDSLEVHLLIASWSAENWRWYINFLEGRLQQISNSKLTESMDYTSARRELAAFKHRKTGTWSPTKENEYDEEEDESTSFQQLQKVHFLDEKANEALLIVEADLDVLLNVHKFYGEASKDLRNDRRPGDCRHGEVAAFQSQLSLIRSELSTHKQRLQALLRLLEGRKSLVCRLNSQTLFRILTFASFAVRSSSETSS